MYALILPLLLWTGDPSRAVPRVRASELLPVEVLEEAPPAETRRTDRTISKISVRPKATDTAAPTSQTTGDAAAKEKAAPSAPEPAPASEAALWPQAQRAVKDVIGELNPVALPRKFLDIALGPVREANLLLPEEWDPFADNVPGQLLSGTSDAEPPQPEFKLSEQAALLGSRLAARQDTPVELAKWHWRAEAGGSFRQGNTSTTNIRSLLQAERHTIRGDVLGKVGAIYDRAPGAEPNRRAFGELLADRNLRGRWISYAREEIEYDEAKLVDLRTVSSAGLGFRFIDRLDRRLIARSGPTISYVLYDPRASNDDEMKSGWLIEGEYRRRLGQATRFEWTTSAFPDFDSEQQFRVRNEGALLFPIGGKASAWNWKVGVKHEYQVDPVGATRANDIEGYFAISFVK